MNNISVIIPAYNEENNLAEVVKETQAVLNQISDQYEVILVNDGSTDRTDEVIQYLIGGNTHIQVIKHEKKEGIGNSLRDGFCKAKYEFITILPADGQIRPSDLKRFSSSIEDVDMVVSYYRSYNPSMLRIIMSKGVRFLLFLLFGRLPRFDGIYMFRRKILNKIQLVSSSFVLNFELVIKAHQQNFKFKEIAIDCLPRATGRSKVVNPKKIFQVFLEIIKLRTSKIGKS